MFQFVIVTSLTSAAGKLSWSSSINCRWSIQEGKILLSLLGPSLVALLWFTDNAGSGGTSFDSTIFGKYLIKIWQSYGKSSSFSTSPKALIWDAQIILRLGTWSFAQISSENDGLNVRSPCKCLFFNVVDCYLISRSLPSLSNCSKVCCAPGLSFKSFHFSVTTSFALRGAGCSAVPCFWSWMLTLAWFISSAVMVSE